MPEPPESGARARLTAIDTADALTPAFSAQDARPTLALGQEPVESPIRFGVSVPDTIPDILVLDRPIEPDELRVLVDRFFQDMVKYVVDVERSVIAIGGELHADAEALRDRIRELTFRLVGRGESLS